MCLLKCVFVCVCVCVCVCVSMIMLKFIPWKALCASGTEGEFFSSNDLCACADNSNGNYFIR